MPRRRLVVKTEKDFTRKTSREAMRGLQGFAQSHDFARSFASCNALEDPAKQAASGSCLTMEPCHSANNCEIGLWLEHPLRSCRCKFLLMENWLHEPNPTPPLLALRQPRYFAPGAGRGRLFRRPHGTTATARRQHARTCILTVCGS